MREVKGLIFTLLVIIKTEVKADPSTTNLQSFVFKDTGLNDNPAFHPNYILSNMEFRKDGMEIPSRIYNSYLHSPKHPIKMELAATNNAEINSRPERARDRAFQEQNELHSRPDLMAILQKKALDNEANNLIAGDSLVQSEGNPSVEQWSGISEYLGSPKNYLAIYPSVPLGPTLFYFMPRSFNFRRYPVITRTRHKRALIQSRQFPVPLYIAKNQLPIYSPTFFADTIKQPKMAIYNVAKEPHWGAPGGSSESSSGEVQSAGLTEDMLYQLQLQR